MKSRIATPLNGCIRIDRILCSFQHHQAACDAVPEMNYVLKHRSDIENCEHYEDESKHTFTSFKGNIVCELPGFQTLRGEHGTSLASIESIPRGCNKR